MKNSKFKRVYMYTTKQYLKQKVKKKLYKWKKVTLPSQVNTLLELSFHFC